MAHAQKPDFVFRRNGRVHLNRRWPQFSRLLAAEVCASAVVMLDIPCSEVVWRVLDTHSIRQFPLHFPSRVSPCATTFQLDSTQIFVIISNYRTQQAGNAVYVERKGLHKLNFNKSNATVAETTSFEIMKCGTWRSYGIFVSRNTSSMYVCQS
jgi:hypothetical protein